MSDSGRIHISIEQGRHNQFFNIIERDRFGGAGTLVWGGSRMNFHVLQGGSVTGTRYCIKILLPHVRLFRSAVDLDFLFMYDKATPRHTTVAASRALGG